MILKIERETKVFLNGHGSITIQQVDEEHYAQQICLTPSQIIKIEEWFDKNADEIYKIWNDGIEEKDDEIGGD